MWSRGLVAIVLWVAATARAQEAPATEPRDASAEADDTDAAVAHAGEPPPSDEVVPTEIPEARDAETSEATPTGEANDGAAATAPLAPEADRRDPAWFRGRQRDTTPEEVLLWIPRIIFFPLHLVAEAVRQLLIATLSWAEENHIFGILPVVFHPTDEFWWYPTLSLEAGIFTQVGLTVRFENLGVAGHHLRVAGSFGGDDLWSIRAIDRWQFGPVRLGVRGGYATRRNNQFFGLGPNTRSQFVYFGSTHGDATAFAVIEHEDHVELEIAGGYSFEEILPGSTPSIDPTPDAVRRLGLARYELALASAELRLDTREEVEENGGLHLHAGAVYGVAPEGSAAHFLRFDVDLEGAIEVYPDRILALRGYLAETVSLDGNAIPFLHQPTLGWQLHRGFVGGRFRGDAAVVAELRYRYPIHYFVDMEWTVSAGNVFARDFSDFSFGALTGALSVGFRTRRTGFDPISFALAFGSTQFDRFDFDGVRFYVASTHGL